jgi:hypothetical protein
VMLAEALQTGKQPFGYMLFLIGSSEISGWSRASTSTEVLRNSPPRCNNVLYCHAPGLANLLVHRFLESVPVIVLHLKAAGNLLA